MGKQQRFMDGERLKLIEYGLRSAVKDPALHHLPEVRESLLEDAELIRRKILELNWKINRTPEQIQLPKGQ